MTPCRSRRSSQASPRSADVPPGERYRGRLTASGRRRQTALIRSPCSRPRRRRVSKNWSRSGTGECWSLHSRFIAARPRSWRPICPRRLTQGSPCRRAAMLISPTSGASQPRTAGSCLARTILTKRCPVRGSGMSSEWRPASRSPAETSGYPPIAAASSWPTACASTARRCGSSPRRATSTFGTTASTRMS
jgi:hypothetical protein